MKTISNTHVFVWDVSSAIQEKIYCYILAIASSGMLCVVFMRLMKINVWMHCHIYSSSARSWNPTCTKITRVLRERVHSRSVLLESPILFRRLSSSNMDDWMKVWWVSSIDWNKTKIQVWWQFCKRTFLIFLFFTFKIILPLPLTVARIQPPHTPNWQIGMQK